MSNEVSGKNLARTAHLFRLIFDCKITPAKKIQQSRIEGIFHLIYHQEKGYERLAGEIFEADNFVGDGINGQARLTFDAGFADDVFTVADYRVNADI